MSNLLYNPVIDLGAALFLVGIVLTLARHNVRRFAWVVVLGAAVVLGGWFFPLQSAQLGALLHFPAAKTALRSVPVSQIKAIAAGKAPADELTPQYVASLKLHRATPGFNSFNGAAQAIANSPMAHNAKWVAETAVLAVLEGNGTLADALGYAGARGVTGIHGDIVIPQNAKITVRGPHIPTSLKITYIPPGATQKDIAMVKASLPNSLALLKLEDKNAPGEIVTIELSPAQKVLATLELIRSNVRGGTNPARAASPTSTVAGNMKSQRSPKWWASLASG